MATNYVCSTCKTYCTSTGDCNAKKNLVVNGCKLKNNTVILDACRYNEVNSICLGCNPVTGNDMTLAEVTKIELYAWYVNSEGHRVMTINVNSIDDPTNFNLVSNKTFGLIFQPEDTQHMPSGHHMAEIYVTTVGGGRTLFASFTFEVHRSHLGDLAPPIVIAQTVSCEFLTINLSFAGSTNPAIGGTICSFEVDWGDGSTPDVVDVEGVEDEALWVAEHTYSANYDGAVVVTATACPFDENDICETPPHTHHTTYVQVCAARNPLAVVSVTETGVVDSSASFSVEPECAEIVDMTVTIRPETCREPIIVTATGLPADAATVAGYVLGGSVEQLIIDWIAIASDFDTKVVCIETVVSDECLALNYNTESEIAQIAYNIPTVSLPVVNSNTGLAMDCPLEFPVIAAWDETAYEDQATLDASVQAYLDVLMGAGNSIAVYNEDTCTYEVCYSPVATPPTEIPVRPLDSDCLEIVFSDGSGVLPCNPQEFPIILASDGIAYFDRGTFLAAYQAQLDATYGAGLTIASWTSNALCTIDVQYYPTVAWVEVDVQATPLTQVLLDIVDQTTVLAVNCPLEFALQAFWTGASTTIFFDAGTLVQAFSTFVAGNNAQPQYAVAELAPDGCSVLVSSTAGAVVPADVRVNQL